MEDVYDTRFGSVESHIDAADFSAGLLRHHYRINDDEDACDISFEDASYLTPHDAPSQITGTPIPNSRSYSLSALPTTASLPDQVAAVHSCYQHFNAVKEKAKKMVWWKEIHAVRRALFTSHYAKFKNRPWKGPEWTKLAESGTVWDAIYDMCNKKPWIAAQEDLQEELRRLSNLREKAHFGSIDNALANFSFKSCSIKHNTLMFATATKVDAAILKLIRTRIRRSGTTVPAVWERTTAMKQRQINIPSYEQPSRDTSGIVGRILGRLPWIQIQFRTAVKTK
ncbi:hypothetical protein GMOD_00010443 [Pyrenophora seminiperda CCB06]|uniref:Uncharacterized protein n=1 Tax=Pyrenophora seminiperda CCB06 TaxID=1302712 RepID=A0A3M7MEJ5_9PLEO|nr:hypothetical protein GMOD_00010443 [Pyrenophora seminiperda CCB06]